MKSTVTREETKKATIYRIAHHITLIEILIAIVVGAIGGVLSERGLNRHALSYSAYERECYNDSTEEYRGVVATPHIGWVSGFRIGGLADGKWHNAVPAEWVDTSWTRDTISITDAHKRDSILAIVKVYTHRTPTIEGYGGWCRERTK